MFGHVDSSLCLVPTFDVGAGARAVPSKGVRATTVQTNHKVGCLTLNISLLQTPEPAGLPKPRKRRLGVRRGVCSGIRVINIGELRFLCFFAYTAAADVRVQDG